MKVESQKTRVTRHDVLAGTGLAVALVVVYLGILFGSAAVPGTPLNEGLERTAPLAGNPTDAEIHAWFQSAESVVVFGSVVVPVITGFIAAVARFILPAGTVVWLIAAVGWLVFFFTFSGIGLRETAGAVAFVAILAFSDYFVRRRTATASAA
jgi:hypothetical protein